MRIAPIVAAYAVGVAMNGFLPANIGTFVTLMMFMAIIPSATFGGSIAAYLVQKIFFTIAGTFVYLYLFLSVPGSFDVNLGGLKDHPVSRSIVVVVGGRPHRHARPDLLAAGEEALGRRRSRVERSSRTPASTCSARSSPRSSPGSASSA